MKCRFCGSMIPEGEIRCGVCGFTHVNFTDGDNTDALNKMIQRYKQSKFGGTGIFLVSHKYVIENGAFSDYKTALVKIADAAELEPGEIVWLGKSFFGSDTDKTIVVEICVDKGEKTYYDFSLDIEKADDLSIGVVRTEGLKAKIAVGNNDKYVLSEEFDLC